MSKEKNILKFFRLSMTPHGFLDPSVFANRKDLLIPLLERVEAALALGSSITVLFVGPYGAGKTHTMKHIAWYLKSKRKVRHVFYSTCPILSAKSTFVDLYRQIVVGFGQKFVFELMNAIGKELLKEYTEEKTRAEALINGLTDVLEHRDFASVISAFLTETEETPYLAWKWLTGSRLSLREKRFLGVVNDNSTPLNAIQTLLTIIRANYKIKKVPMTILIDELEQLSYVRPVVGSTFVQCFRLLVEERRGLVLFLSVAGNDIRDVSLFSFPGLFERISHPNIVFIPSFRSEEARNFIQELIRTVRVKGIDSVTIDTMSKSSHENFSFKYFPFSDETIEKITMDKKPLTPRSILHELSNLLGKAALKKRLIVTSDMVE